MAQFTGITQDMFCVYVPEKWSSNVHTLTRMRNKDALMAMCSQVEGVLQPSGGLSGLARSSTDEFPNISNNKRVEAQWVFWFRDAEARQSLATFLERTPLHEKTIFNIALQDKHAVMAVALKNDGLFVGLRIAQGASIDRRNLMAKLSQSWERERALGLLGALGQDIVVRLGDAERSGTDIDAKALVGLSEQLGPDGPDLTIGRHFSTEDIVALGPDLTASVCQVTQGVLPIYRFAAWTKENDLIEVSKQLQVQKAQRKRDLVSFHLGDKVRIVSGLFSGKVGVVQDIDAKAQVRVRVGKLSVTVGGADLARAS